MAGFCGKVSDPGRILRRLRGAHPGHPTKIRITFAGAVGVGVTRRARPRLGHLPSAFTGANRTDTRQTHGIPFQRSADLGTRRGGDTLFVAGIRGGAERGLQSAALLRRLVSDTRHRCTRVDFTRPLHAGRRAQLHPLRLHPRHTRPGTWRHVARYSEQAKDNFAIGKSEFFARITFKTITYRNPAPWKSYSDRQWRTSVTPATS